MFNDGSLSWCSDNNWVKGNVINISFVFFFLCFREVMERKENRNQRRNGQKKMVWKGGMERKTNSLTRFLSKSKQTSDKERKKFSHRIP